MSKPLPVDHWAYRVTNREEAAQALTLLGYEIVEEFDLVLEDGSTAKSYALTHPFSPEIFVSAGPLGSKIDDWVGRHGDIGAVHHVAYAVENVWEAKKEWEADGVEFDREEPLVCPCDEPLVQIFTKPDPRDGLIRELITRNGHPGFCKENVRRLMSGSVD